MTTSNRDDDFCFISENIPQTPENSPPPRTNPFDDISQDQNNSEKYLCIDVGLKNLSWCVLENSESLNKIIYEHGVKSIYSKKANEKIDWEEVNDNLYTLFQEELPILMKYQNQIKGIYIERQPRRNTNACLLAASIYTFFYTQMRAIRREGHNFWLDIPIEYMDSRKKLSPETLVFDIPSSSIPIKTYYQRKKEAVRRVLNLIDYECVVYQDDFLLEHSETSSKLTFEMNGKKKKDDLADSLLMCYFIALQKDKEKLTSIL